MKVFRNAARFSVLAILLATTFLASGRPYAPAQGEAVRDTKHPKQVFIIRHGEKTGEKSDPHLDARGKERAAALYRLFEASEGRPQPFPKPDFLFAASNSKGSHRPLETIEPLAMKLMMPINDKYDSKLPSPPTSNGEQGDQAKAPDMRELRSALFGEDKYFGKTILVSWRHGTIPELAKTLKATTAPTKWPDEVFDRVWQITYDDQGGAEFLDRPQRLLPGDSEK